MSSKANSRPYAVAVVAASVATLGYMWVAGRAMKKEEGPASMFKTVQEGSGLMSGTTDAKMSSADVREVVQGDKKPNKP